MKKLLLCCVLFAAGADARQSAPNPGQHSFETRCAVCHGSDGHGSDRAPSLSGFVASNTDEQIASLVRSGIRAMPPHPDIADPEMKDLLAYLRTISPAAPPQVREGSAKMQDGRVLRGEILNESNFDMQLATSDGKIHLLIRDGEMYHEKPVLPKTDWPRYDGSYTSNRNSAMDQINTGNVRNLTLNGCFRFLARRVWKARRW